MSRLKRYLLASTLVLSAGIGVASAGQKSTQSSIPSDRVTQESLKFARVYQDLLSNYMDRPSPDRLILEGAVRGMLASLDPFSSFFDRQQYEQLQEETRGEMLGFGSILYVSTGKVMVIQTQQGSPSWRGGLGPGDEIVAVNGVVLSTLNFQDLIHLLQQARAHPVTLSVLRPGDNAPVAVHLRPAQVALPTVDLAFRYSPDIGYIRVASFEAKTPQELVRALKQLDYERLSGLILDLRNNPGGLLAAAIGVCSVFTKPGTLVLTVRGRKIPEQSYATVSAPLETTVPLIVLVNGNTASAAEVVTAALQDHDRALVVGEPTFGKGVVESVMPLSDETAVALLTSEYFTPSGRSIQKPLPGTALANPISSLAPAGIGQSFHTADGRPIEAHGGIAPDVLAAPEPTDQWLAFLDQAGLFSRFASEYVTYHAKITKTFQPDAETLEEFRNFLRTQRIRSPEPYWAKDQQALKRRLRQALFDLVYGLDFSNEQSELSDPQVAKAASLFHDLPSLLRGPTSTQRSVVRNHKPEASEL